jgi:prephenate dehydratase
MKIAHLGIPGSNSYSAAKQYFGTNHEYIGVSKFIDIFTQVLDGTVNAGIIPVENSLAGTISENYDLLNRFDVKVTGEYYLKFENHLLGLPCHLERSETQSRDPINTSHADDVKTNGISHSVRNDKIDLLANIKHLKKVYSHPQPLSQCSTFFEKHPWLEKIAYSDTAAAAKHVADSKDPTLAAIGNTEAAQLYNLEIIQPNIADNVENNYTRFFIIEKKQTTIPNNADKCSLIFTLPHVAGSLVKALTVFSDNNINLTKIESRPIHGKPFEYLFYTDIKWNSDQNIQKIIKEFKQTTQSLHILGYYKSGMSFRTE